MKVEEFLKGGDRQVIKYYHLLKTHKIPTNIDAPEGLLNENGYSNRGIMSSVITHTKGLSCVVDSFVQPGIKEIDTFLKDGKHTLQTIEKINDELKEGDHCIIPSRSTLAALIICLRSKIFKFDKKLLNKSFL